MLAADHEPAREHAVADRGGAHDGGAGGHVLPQLPRAPAAITLDIDDTCDPAHGHQQLSLFHAHYDTRCFLPIHVYHIESGKPVVVFLRPGKTPSGGEVRAVLKLLFGVENCPLSGVIDV